MYNPVFEGPIEGYVVKYLKNNGWKLRALMDYEDMLQEAKLLFLMLKGRYSEMDTPQHFMAIFKTSWNNHVIDLAKKDSQIRAHILESDMSYNSEEESYESFFTNIIGEVENKGLLNLKISQAPNEVRMVLSLFLNAPTELLDSASLSWKDSGRNKDYGNRMLCKLLGVKEGTDLIGKVEEYFTT